MACQNSKSQSKLSSLAIHLLGRLQDSEGSGVGRDEPHQWGNSRAVDPVGAEWSSGSNNKPAASQRCQNHFNHFEGYKQHVQGERMRL